MDLSHRDLSWEILKIEILRDRTTLSEVNVCFILDLPPCESRLGDILRARDRPKPPTGPLTATRGACWVILPKLDQTVCFAKVNYTHRGESREASPAQCTALNCALDLYMCDLFTFEYLKVY